MTAFRKATATFEGIMTLRSPSTAVFVVDVVVVEVGVVVVGVVVGVEEGLRDLSKAGSCSSCGSGGAEATVSDKYSVFN